MEPGDTRVIDRAGLDRLVDVLHEQRYRVIGPQERDGAIVLDDLVSGARLPAGWSVDTEPGRYRLRRRDDAAVFAHSAGPGSWKQFLHPPHRKVWETGPELNVQPAEESAQRLAFLGVRGCDLAAMAILGRVLDGGTRIPIPDLPVAVQVCSWSRVNCTEPGGVCFCVSMGTGPGASQGYDLALTEMIDAAGHRFLVDIGTEAGADVLEQVTALAAGTTDVAAARTAVEDAAGRMGRAMPDADLRAVLRDSHESPQWQDVASRCLTCGNCTMVCPTCFCTTAEDVTDLTGDHAERWERWVSCFELDFSYQHGGSVRQSGESRYRQWITHKLGTWHDQFDSSGCVGCGRCIAWCPAGIDITAEMSALAEGNSDADSG